MNWPGFLLGVAIAMGVILAVKGIFGVATYLLKRHYEKISHR